MLEQIDQYLRLLHSFVRLFLFLVSCLLVSWWVRLSAQSAGALSLCLLSFYPFFSLLFRFKERSCRPRPIALREHPARVSIPFPLVEQLRVMG